MADPHQVKITARALADLSGAAECIRSRSPANAPIVAERIINAIDSLSFMPARFKKVGRSREHGHTVHAMVVRPFIVYYRVHETAAAVFILSIVHGARRQPRRFE